MSEDYFLVPSIPSVSDFVKISASFFRMKITYATLFCHTSEVFLKLPSGITIIKKILCINYILGLLFLVWDYIALYMYMPTELIM